MSHYTPRTFKVSSLSNERFRQLRDLIALLQHFAMYLRMYYGESLLYIIRTQVDSQTLTRWLDAYDMAIQRAERATTVLQKFLIMDEFYKDLLREAFETPWLRRFLEALQKDGMEIMFITFDRESGIRHLVFPTLTEVNTVKFDANTSRRLNDEVNGFTNEDVERLRRALEHRKSVTYFDGLLYKDKPLALEPISRFDPDRMAKWDAMHPTTPAPRSWLARLLDWLIPSRKDVA